MYLIIGQEQQTNHKLYYMYELNWLQVLAKSLNVYQSQ